MSTAAKASESASVTTCEATLSTVWSTCPFCAQSQGAELSAMLYATAKKKAAVQLSPSQSKAQERARVARSGGGAAG